MYSEAEERERTLACRVGSFQRMPKAVSSGIITIGSTPTSTCAIDSRSVP